MNRKQLKAVLGIGIISVTSVCNVAMCEAGVLYPVKQTTVNYDTDGTETNHNEISIKSYALPGGYVSVYEGANMLSYKTENGTGSMSYDENGNIRYVTNTTIQENGDYTSSQFSFGDFKNASVSFSHVTEKDEYGKTVANEVTSYRSSSAEIGNMSGFSEDTQAFQYSSEYDDQGLCLTRETYQDGGSEPSSIAKYEYQDGKTLCNTYGSDGSLLYFSMSDSESGEIYEPATYTDDVKVYDRSIEFAQEPTEAAELADLYQGIWTIDLEGTGMEDWFGSFSTIDEGFANGQALYVNNQTGTVQYFMEEEILDAAINPDDPSQICVWDTSNGNGAGDFSAAQMILTYDKETDTFNVSADGTESFTMRRF